MSDKNIQTVVNNELCFGCGTCNVACPVKSIQMNYSTFGRLLPEVDAKICIQCGLCLKVCPGIDISGDLSNKIEPTLFGEVQGVLSCRSTNDNIYNNSQSGGAITETLSFLFDEGKIDAALVVIQEKQHAKYHVVTDKRELYNSQTSQYTPVDLVSGLPLLSKYNHTAVVGIPCHLEGIIKLKKQFPNKFMNIEYLLGLICAGTQSQLMVDVVKNIGKKTIGEISENEQIRWRQKKYSNYQRADIAIVAPDGRVRMLDNNIRHIAKQYLTSPRCMLCFDKMNLYADVVYGDAWGVRGDDKNKGANVIVCRTERGMALIDEMLSKRRLIGHPCQIEEVCEGQGMKNKKKTINKMAAIYAQKSWLAPGWLKNEVFEVDNNCDVLKKKVNDYMARSNRQSKMIICDVSKKIRRQLVIMNLKRFMRRILK